MDNEKFPGETPEEVAKNAMTNTMGTPLEVGDRIEVSLKSGQIHRSRTERE